ncbi:MAG: GNAT family N-acetyltransferase [Promethearchaeota archaeon]
MAISTGKIEIYSGDEALDFLVQQKPFLEELLGNESFRFPMPATTLNPTYLKCVRHVSSYFHVGAIENEREVQALLPLLGISELPSPPLNRMEFLLMQPTTRLSDVQLLLEKMLQIVDRLNIPLRFYFYEFLDPKVKQILVQLGFQEASKIKSLLFDLINVPDVPLKEEIKLIHSKDPPAWWPQMLIPYNLPRHLIDNIANLLAKRELSALDAINKTFHRFIALDSNEQAVGCIEFLTAAQYPMWTSLAVNENVRGRGIATSIIKAVREESKRLNYTKAIGDVDVTNTPTFRLHSKWGYQEMATIISFDRKKANE